MIKLLYRLLFTWIFFKKNIFFDNSEPMLIVVWKYFFHCCGANNQSINHQSAGTRIEERENITISPINLDQIITVGEIWFWARNWISLCGFEPLRHSSIERKPAVARIIFFQLIFFSRFLSEFSIHFFANSHAASVLIQLIGR